MITDKETIALLAEAQRIKLEVLTAEPGMELACLKALLSKTPPAYSLIIERLYFDVFDIQDAIKRIENRSSQVPTSVKEMFIEYFVRPLWRSRAGRVALVLVVVLFLVASGAFTLWTNLPEWVQRRLVEPPHEALLVVTDESAGPVEIRPGGGTIGKSAGAGYVVSLTLRLRNPGNGPLRLEPGMLLLGARPEPCLAGLVLFSTSPLGAHASRQETLRVVLIPLRPAALPTDEKQVLSAEQIPESWLRLPVVDAGGQEETQIFDLGPHAFSWATRDLPELEISR